MHYGCAIAERMQRTSKSKQAGTAMSRKNHFLAWCNRIGAIAAGTAEPDLQVRNFILACYAISLVNGETLLSRKVRYGTLKNYMSAATKCHTDLGLPSPRSAPVDYVKIVLEAVRKYELVPDRREMIHDSMFDHMLTLYRKYHQMDPDCLVVCLCEWLFLGRYTGCRREEWCNESGDEYKRIDDPEWGDRPDARSLIIDDFAFFDERGAPVPLTRPTWRRPLSELPENISYVEVCFRKQKNNDNYQKIPYSRTSKNPLLCPVRAAFRIACRGLRLGAPRTHPAAIYWDSRKDTFRLITCTQTNAFLRKVASKTFNIRPDCKSLQKWSTHSIRVTAANLLHRARFSDTYIKNRLRWKSDSFMMYLRNTFYTAKDHASALDLVLSPHTPADVRPLEEHEQMIARTA